MFKLWQLLNFLIKNFKVIVDKHLALFIHFIPLNINMHKVSHLTSSSSDETSKQSKSFAL